MGATRLLAKMVPRVITEMALYVLACLAEREPVVIAARLAAEIAAGRTAHLIALRQASHAVSAALTEPTPSSRPTSPVRPTGPGRGQRSSRIRSSRRPVFQSLPAAYLLTRIGTGVQNLQIGHRRSPATGGRSLSLDPIPSRREPRPLSSHGQSIARTRVLATRRPPIVAD